jgi:Flp pilus assembly pilin Flp
MGSTRKGSANSVETVWQPTHLIGLLFPLIVSTRSSRLSDSTSMGPDGGATTAEYGVISIGIAVAVIVAVNPMGSQFKTMIGAIASLIGAAFR